MFVSLSFARYLDKTKINEPVTDLYFGISMQEQVNLAQKIKAIRNYFLFLAATKFAMLGGQISNYKG